MSLETDLRAYLLAQAGISNLIGTRLHIGRRVQGDPTPNVSYKRVSDQRFPDLNAAAGYCIARIQFDFFDRDFIDAKAVAEAFREELDGLGRATLNGSTVVEFCWHAGEILIPTNLDDGSDNHVHQLAVDYLIQFQETVPTF